jgi:hypothetical protein
MFSRFKRPLIVAALLGVLALIWFLHSPRTEPLSEQQIELELHSLAALTVEFTSSPVLLIEEPSRVLGVAVPFSSERSWIPVRGAVRGGFRPEALARITSRLDGDTLELQLLPPEILEVRAEIDTASLPAGLPPEVLTGLKPMAEARLRQEAMDRGLLTLVEDGAVRQLTVRLQRFGYQLRASFYHLPAAPH